MEAMKPLQLQAYEALRARLAEGAFAPGVLYSETRTARELGISRTPTRDAIQRLAQEGYVDVLPSRGFRLHRLTERDVVETYQVRSALEGYCAIQLSQSLETPAARETLAALEALAAEQRAVLEGDGSVEAFTRLDEAFHRRLVAWADNAAIAGMYDAFCHRMERQTRATLAAPGRMAETLAEHREIVEQIRTGSLAGAYGAVLAHLDRTRAMALAQGVEEA